MLNAWWWDLYKIFIKSIKIHGGNEKKKPDIKAVKQDLYSQFSPQLQYNFTDSHILDIRVILYTQ